MAIAAELMSAPTMTYEDYMTEGEVFKRYDIIDGVRIIRPNPTRFHQRILMNILEMFRIFERAFESGLALLAPCDVLIRRSPLRTRQPDVAFISNEQLARNAGEDDPAPLDHAPELVVEILSPSERSGAREEKLLDYCSVGVRECWVIHPGTQTVEVLRLNRNGYEIVATYGVGETARAIAFPELIAPVDAIFAG